MGTGRVPVMDANACGSVSVLSSCSPEWFGEPRPRGKSSGWGREQRLDCGVGGPWLAIALLRREKTGALDGCRVSGADQVYYSARAGRNCLDQHGRSWDSIASGTARVCYRI